MPKVIDEVKVYASANGQHSHEVKMTGPGSEAKLRVASGNDFTDGRGNSGHITIREISPGSITVQLSRGGNIKTTPIQVTPSWTVAELKTHLKEFVGVDLAKSDMMIRIPSLKEELKDNRRTLQSYGIKKNVVMEVYPKSQRGG